MSTLSYILDALVKIHETSPETAAEFASQLPRRIANLQLDHLADLITSYLENDQ